MLGLLPIEAPESIARSGQAGNKKAPTGNPVEADGFVAFGEA